MSFHNNAIFWVEVEKIVPNPFQPRRFFDEQKLKDLSDSIRQYGVLQPLVVTQREHQRDDGGLSVQYELIAGERRLRASKMAGLSLVPVIIRDDEESEQMKLELAIIENLQREDINPIERARAFAQLAEHFGLKHGEIANKIGRSREYVSNTIRLLLLPVEMQQALSEGKITEGHTRPLLMLIDRPEEQLVLFKEIILNKLTVRDAEQISRRIATDKVRRHDRLYDPDIIELETRASERLGTRVRVEPKEVGGRIFIDFVSEEDLRKILAVLNNESTKLVEQPQEVSIPVENMATGSEVPVATSPAVETVAGESVESPTPDTPPVVVDTQGKDDDLYSITHFSV